MVSQIDISGQPVVLDGGLVGYGQHLGVLPILALLPLYPVQIQKCDTGQGQDSSKQQDRQTALFEMSQHS